MAGIRGRAAPPRAACRAAADARAHAFDDELCPVHRPATSCVARGSRAHFGVGLGRPNWRPAGSESSFEVAGAVDSSGRGVSTPERDRPAGAQRRRRCARYALLSIVGTLQHVKNLYDERAKALIAWTERHNKCFTYLCCGHRNKRRPRSARNKATQRERHVRKHRAKRSQ